MKNDDIEYGKKLAYSPETNRIYLLTKWRQTPTGHVSPVQKHDMTDEFHMVVGLAMANRKLTIVKLEMIRELEELNKLVDNEALDLFEKRNQIEACARRMMEIYRSSHRAQLVKEALGETKEAEAGIS